MSSLLIKRLCQAAVLAAILTSVPATRSVLAQEQLTVPARTWQGIPGLERSARGRLFISWFTGGPKEPAPENTVVLAYSDDEGRTFTEPQALAVPSDGSRCFDPTLWIDPRGRLWYIFNRGNKTSAVHDVHARICDDPDANPPVFGEEFRVGYDAPYAFRMNKITVLSTGEWIMPVTLAQEPIHAWFAGSKQLQGVGISTDEGKSWTLHGAVQAPEWALECMITELRDGRLWMLIRTGGGVLWESFSTDKGRTWSEGQATTIASPGSRFFIRRLSSGNLLLVNHYKFKGRSHLTARISQDEGATWNEGLLLDERSNVSYPDGVEDHNGLIWITYDRERQGAGDILFATFCEADVLAGKNVSGQVRLKQQANSLDALKLVPDGWDPALAGDEVMKGLVKATAPEVKGAHDAEFACVDDRAYIVAEVNDTRSGESSAWPEIYCTLSIVNLNTLKLEEVIPFARGEQKFDNETLPVGACFVPRILQKDDKTLRCFFASEQPGKRQAQTWYRDFNLATRQFEATIHKVKLKTVAGVVDMQPRNFHADAVTHGFKKPARDYGLYLVDSFKDIDGKKYIALNNFPGQQNALAIVHDDLATFEVVGHYNEPQSAALSESAVNRLPDGTWMAICRNDRGNYHFTTSPDGRTWSVGKELPVVPNGANSKPTFDKFGDTYYLGWQEATKIHGANRSVFNIDISRDGRHWQRKYRFETPRSFQYPTFHEHSGSVWLCVTQGDSSPSRKERIMFGKLEEVGKFSSQAGKQRTPIPAPVEEPAIMKQGVKLFTDRDYTLTEAPDFLLGRPFVRTSIEGYEVVCTKPGEIFVMTLSKPHESNRGSALQKLGFEKVDTPEFQLFPGELNRVFAWKKSVKEGERLKVRKLGLLVTGAGAEVKIYRPEPARPWNENTGEALYNGIVLPDAWPPQHLKPDGKPMPVPYLQFPPKVIPIDVGRQLFVDDYLVESTDLKRTFHHAKKYEGNPVFKAETTRELGPSTQGEGGQEATTFTGQGGVFYDPTDKLFKLFYVAGWRGPLSLATSPDMIHWTRPELNLAGGNALLPEGLAWTGPELKTGGSDNCVWLDLNATDPAQRIKFLTCWMHVPANQRPKGFHHSLHVSDGRSWSPGVPTGMADDYCSFFYNPFRNKWCFSIKQGTSRGRSRYYSESDEFLKGADWSNSVFWTSADELDLPEPEGRYPGAGEPAQLYSLNAVAYESLMVGMHYIHRGPNNGICDKGKFPKLVDLELGFSRDGFHWDRPDRSGFVVGSRTEGAWDRGYLHSTAGMFVVLNDQLVFPYMGTSGIAPNGKRGMYTGGSIGLATLRRDGFASLDAGAVAGTLTTRPVTFKGKQLFVNVNAPQGELRVQLLDSSGQVLATSKPLAGDTTKQRVEWTHGQSDLAKWTGQPVRFRFQLSNGQLYSFWVSEDAGGASNGYVAAGGPEFSGVRDLAPSSIR